MPSDRAKLQDEYKALKKINVELDGENLHLKKLIAQKKKEGDRLDKEYAEKESLLGSTVNTLEKKAIELKEDIRKAGLEYEKVVAECTVEREAIRKQREEISELSQKVKRKEAFYEERLEALAALNEEAHELMASVQEREEEVAYRNKELTTVLRQAQGLESEARASWDASKAEVARLDQIDALLKDRMLDVGLREQAVKSAIENTTQLQARIKKDLSSLNEDRRDFEVFRNQQDIEIRERTSKLEKKEEEVRLLEESIRSRENSMKLRETEVKMLNLRVRKLARDREVADELAKLSAGG
jgi:chromosome segregation ATPase